MELTVTLLVLRCMDIEKSREFYELLGFDFVKEKHGKGPEHYASGNMGYVFELYPLEIGEKPDQCRLGFSLSHIAELSGKLIRDKKIYIVKSMHDLNNSVAIFVKDPDGRTVEISQPFN